MTLKSREYNGLRFTNLADIKPERPKIRRCCAGKGKKGKTRCKNDTVLGKILRSIPP
jgi:hypothetical protein